MFSTDFFATILDLAGLPLMPIYHRDGVSLMSLLQGQTQWDRQTLYWHYPHSHGSSWRPGAAIRHGDWKLIEFYDPARIELYNLSVDPQETSDLSSSDSDQAQLLLTFLPDWQQDINAKMPTPIATSTRPGRGR